ncbi:MAG: dipeptidase, partial [Deltaproteobacteria bacterium]|nr:dipeptidase [Deltaproteobacteria bacterium]
ALRETDCIDLHIDTFIPMRLWSYDINERHGPGVLRGRFAGHLDLPRIEEANLASAMWSVTTNPFRTKGGRWKTAVRNFEKLRDSLNSTEGRIRIAGTYDQYVAARDEGAHVALLSIQGGNAIDGAPDDELPDPDLTRVTLVHLTNSMVGRSSQPVQLSYQPGLTDHGRDMVAKLNRRRVFVDLAHISKEGFWQAVEAHDSSQPFLVTHTGVEGVTPHWRNLDDEQIRAVADSGGVVGIMFHVAFLKREGPRDVTMVIDHLEHVIDVVGEDFAAIGSDYDGAITPPRDLRSGESYPLLVAEMLSRGWSTGRIEKVLGGNFLRAFRELRP